MIVFWLVCAGLVAIALAFVIPSLLNPAGKQIANSDKDVNVDVYRDQLSELEADLRNGIVSPEQYKLDRDEIERRLLEDVSTTADQPSSKPAHRRALVYLVALGIPFVAVVLYTQIGNSAALVSSPKASTTSAPVEGEMTQQRIESNVTALARRLEQNPNDPQGWTMLGRSYLSLERYAEASNAFARATMLKSDNADLWADYAFAAAMANGRRLQGQPQELIQKALQLDPDNGKALELAGSAAFETKNYQDAIKYWQRLLDMSPKDSELAQTLRERINQAKSLSGTTAK